MQYFLAMYFIVKLDLCISLCFVNHSEMLDSHGPVLCVQAHQFVHWQLLSWRSQGELQWWIFLNFHCHFEPIVVTFIFFQILHEYKFEFLRIVTSHEHYIPLNLPIMRKQVKNYKGWYPVFILRSHAFPWFSFLPSCIWCNIPSELASLLVSHFLLLQQILLPCVIPVLVTGALCELRCPASIPYLCVWFYRWFTARRPSLKLDYRS